MIQLDPEDKELVSTILGRYVPCEEVWVFGSRAKGTADHCSDLDLVIVAEEYLPYETVRSLKFAFCYSYLHFMVDVLEWSQLSKVFQEAIKEYYAVFQQAMR